MTELETKENSKTKWPFGNANVLIAYIVAAIWPFVYYFRFVIPGKEFSLKITNDFWYLYYCKYYLLDKLSNAEFLLWSPSESAGIPFYSNPFTQVFYILNLPLTAFYKIASGYSYYDHQIYTIVGVSIFCVGLLLWLRSLKVNLLYALIAICLIGVSSKMSEILRFTNAVHTVAWLPFILYGCTKALSKGKTLRKFLLISVPAILMITAGYPYNAYYSFFLIIPYSIAAVYLRNKTLLSCEADRSIVSYFALIFSAFAAAFVLCYPYIRSITQLFNQVGFRSGHDFEFSTFFKFNFVDTIGSWIFPPSAHIEGWYYSGMLTFFLIILLYIYSALNYRENKFRFKLLIVIGLWFVIISYLSYGSESYLFKLFWNYVPGFSRLRIIARMNIIFLPVIALLLAYSLKIISDVLSGRKAIDKKKFTALIVILTAVYAVTLGMQLHLLNNPHLQVNSVAYTKSLLPGFDASHAIKFGAVSFTFFMFILIVSRFKVSALLKNAFILIAAVMLIADIYYAGANQWVGKQLPGDTERKVLNVNELNMRSFNTPRNDRNILLQITPAFSIVAIDEWSFERYKDFRKKFEDDAESGMNNMSIEAFAEVMGLNNGKKIFLASGLGHKGITEFYDDVKSFDSLSNSEIRINSYTGDRLEVEIESDREGVLHFIDNWEKNWTATVNGTDTPVELSLGTFKAVKFGAGRSKIVFCYEADFF